MIYRTVYGTHVVTFKLMTLSASLTLSRVGVGCSV